LADSPALEIHLLSSTDSSLRDRLYALLDGFEPAAIDEDEPGDRWRVFFRSPRTRDAAAATVAATLGGALVRTSPIDVPDEDWARRSQESLRAIEAGGLIIAPPWDVPKTRSAKDGTSLPDLPVIVIEPSTGFGTGHHATTRLCLRMLQKLELRGARVLDIGTGSGVLALAAWKLGAADVVAVDNDPDALDNARENIARNGAAASIDIVQDELDALRTQRADVVLANLTGAMLVRYAAELRGLVAEEGYLAVSGFAPRDAAIITTAFAGLTRIDEMVEEEWAAALLRA
jgi:ribosomal protein L11 methyltransferase